MTQNQSPSAKAIVTPTFSKDRSTLSQFPNSPFASSFEEAQELALKWDVTQCRTLHHRLKLDTKEDWISLYKSCDAIVNNDDGSQSVNLEKVLKKCYEIAFAMPPSPNLVHRLTPKTQMSGSSLEPPTLSI